MTTTIQNFGTVEPGKLYRGAQPTDQQFAELQSMGITMVLDLREDVGREEENACCTRLSIIHANVPIGNQHLPMIGHLGVLPPTDAQLRTCFHLMRSGHVIFVHCAHGEDRTGAIVAARRMVFDGWTNEQAMQEAVKFHINPLQVLIREFIEHFDPTPYKQAA